MFVIEFTPNKMVNKYFVGSLIFTALFVVANSKTVQSGDIDYFISLPLKKNWYQAQRYCTSLGMDLVDITSTEENNRIVQIIKNPLHVNVTEPRFWTSGTDNGSEGSFYWTTTGKPFAFTDYYRVWMQPDNYGGNENCIEINGLWDFKWNDEQCLIELYFICREVTKLPLDNCICFEGLKIIY